MRIPTSVFAIRRYALILAVLAASIMMLNGDVKKNVFGVHDAARYADPNVIEYIQPGLTFTIVSAKIAADGTISVDYKIADPTGAALDSAGVVNAGSGFRQFPGRVHSHRAGAVRVVHRQDCCGGYRQCHRHPSLRGFGWHHADGGRRRVHLYVQD